MIKTNSGEIILQSGTIIHSKMIKQDFLNSSLGQQIARHESHVYRDIYTLSPQIIDDLLFTMILFFKKEGYLSELEMIYFDGKEKSWTDWSEDSELNIKKIHDNWLIKVLGSAQYSYSWGNVLSVYDANGGFSKIVVKYMTVDINKRYFYMSHRFDKCKPEDYGLNPLKDQEAVYFDGNDKSTWVRKELYDFGWGKECGFMRLPKLSFNELWYLLMNSCIQESKYGAAAVIEQDYANELLNYLLTILNDPNLQVDSSLKEAVRILGLEKVWNRSEIIGKSYEEIQKDFEQWKLISHKVIEIHSNVTIHEEYKNET